MFEGTPGYQMNGPYTPQTPGTMFNDTGYSPYQPSPGYQSELILSFFFFDVTSSCIDFFLL